MGEGVKDKLERAQRIVEYVVTNYGRASMDDDGRVLIADDILGKLTSASQLLDAMADSLGDAAADVEAALSEMNGRWLTEDGLELLVSAKTTLETGRVSEDPDDDDDLMDDDDDDDEF